jgi:hypothetical protein
MFGTGDGEGLDDDSAPAAIVTAAVNASPADGLDSKTFDKVKGCSKTATGTITIYGNALGCLGLDSGFRNTCALIVTAGPFRSTMMFLIVANVIGLALQVR